MQSLLVGAPVLKRAWIIDEYLERADLAARNAGFVPSYLFVGPEADPTMERIRAWAKINHRTVHLVPFEQEDERGDRHWNEIRFEFMADLRNALLRNVRRLHPDLFLSLDSDILLHPQAIVGALEGIGKFDAVGTKAYLTEFGTECPNYAQLVAGNLHRMDFDGFAPVKVIMAIKLMTPKAYAVDYVTHFQGEDIGWSLQCAEAGVQLGWDGRYPSKHVMSPERLYEFDVRIGW